MEHTDSRPSTATGGEHLEILKRAVALGKSDARYRDGISRSSLLDQDEFKPVGGWAAQDADNAKDDANLDPWHLDILLADYTLEDEDSKKDWDEAISRYQTAATEGSVLALRRLGYCYMTGTGVSKDMTRAMDYYLSAMKQGDEVSAIEYYIALQDASSALRARLKSVGHDISNINIARLDEELVYKIAREREEERGRRAMFYYDTVTNAIQLLLGCIVWVSAAPLRVKLALPAVIGLIGATVEVLTIMKPSQGYDIISVLCCYALNALVLPMCIIMTVFFLVVLVVLLTALV